MDCDAKLCLRGAEGEDVLQVQGWIVVIIAVAYVTLLFAIASLGDRRSAALESGRARPFIYSFSLAIYCTSWTFFGSVGLASERGPEFLAIYVGPVLVFVFGLPLLKRTIRLAKAEKITSIADFLVVASGRSSRQVAAIAEHLVERVTKETGRKVRAEGKAVGDWVLIDTGDIVVHIFRPEIRSFYNLEKMWGGATIPEPAAA